MQSGINIPQTKSVNISLQYAKMNGFFVYFIYVIDSIRQNHLEVCSSFVTTQSHLIYFASGLMFAFNLLSLFYLWLKDQFARFEFYIVFCVNLVWTAFLALDIYLAMLNYPNECESGIVLQKSLIYFLVVVTLEVFITLIFSLPLPFRIVYLPTSLLPLYLIFTSVKDVQTCYDQILIILLGLSAVNLMLIPLGYLLALTLWCFKKAHANAPFKFIIGLATLGQLIILALMAQTILNDQIPSQNICIPTLFAFKTYFLICPVAIILAFLLLMGLKSEDQEDFQDFLINQRFQLIGGKPQQ